MKVILWISALLAVFVGVQVCLATEYLHTENEPPIMIWWHDLKDRATALYYRVSGRPEEAARKATTVSAREAAEKWKQASREADRFAHLVEKEEVGESLWGRLPESIRMAYDKVTGAEEEAVPVSAWQRAKEKAGSLVEQTKETASEAYERMKHPFLKEEPVPESFAEKAKEKIAHLYHRVTGKPEYVEEPVSEGYVTQARDKLAQAYHRLMGQPLFVEPPHPKEPEGFFSRAKGKLTDLFSRATEEYEPETTVQKVTTAASKVTAKAGDLVDATMQQIEQIFGQARVKVEDLYRQATGSPLPPTEETAETSRLKADAEAIWENAKQKAKELYAKATRELEVPAPVSLKEEPKYSWPWQKKAVPEYELYGKPETHLTPQQIQAVSEKVFEEARQKIAALSAGQPVEWDRYGAQRRSIWEAAKAKAAEIYYRATAEPGDEFSLKQAEKAAQWAELARQRAQQAAEAAKKSEESYRSALAG